MLRIITLFICLTLSACMVGPNFKEPAKVIANQWLENSPAVKKAPIKNAQWWQVFHDPVMTRLINEGYYNNLNVQIAGVRVLQARAQLAQSVGELYPQQQASMGNYTYYRIGGSQLQTVLPTSFSTDALGFTSSWELDFWGKYRRAINSNDATFLASLAAYDNALVTLTADVAEVYTGIRTIEAKIKVTNANIAVQAMSLKIARARFRGGQTSLLDVEQAETELAETQASLPKLLSELQHQKDALAVLLGTVPPKINAMLAKVKSRGIPQAAPGIAVGIPREALARRPDITQARLEAIAQSELIGAAKANLYPAFSLNGTFAFAANNIGSSSLSDIFHWSNRTITAGPSFSWPILNYGQITNTVREQDAAFQEALLKYMHAVLKAQQEVQDNITRYIEAGKAEKLLAKANASAEKSTKLALVRYKQGESDFTTVLDAERQMLRVQMSLASAKGEIPKALVALYRSLGGGWQIRGCNDVVRADIKAQMAGRTNWGDLMKQKNHQYPTNKCQRLKNKYRPSW